MEYLIEETDVAVVGAGHAGIEAALAVARLGLKAVIFTMNMDSVGNLPCNPSIGGTAKGHLVREIDALGGEMGRAADATFLQSRMLNRGKGPAVHSLRAQVDRREYGKYMKRCVERQENCLVRQAEIVEIRRQDERFDVVTQMHGIYRAKAVVIATGTFLGGKIFVGDVSYEGGPDGMFAAARLSQSLTKLGVSLRRFKTGTPARVDRKSIDFSHLEVQQGDDPVIPFSYDTKNPGENRVVCHITWTGEKTRQVIKENIGRSPLYAGEIEGVGPRYCPSIEDKIMRFPDKERHQVFLEPCGLDTEEVYVQGVSSSLPEDVQLQIYRSIGGLEQVRMMRTAYAIEYDCCDPQQLLPTLEFREISGLYGAGQFNGSSGYEEAAAQGLVAGINAARKIQGRQPVILERSGSYIGTLIDDLVTKGVSDPYRMMTSRSEYRLVLRQDNADQRLTPLGYELGLISQTRWQAYLDKQRLIGEEMERVRKTTIPAGEAVNHILVSCETSPLQIGVRLVELLKRPTVDYQALESVDITRPALPREVIEQVEIAIKYEGYIKRQLSQIEEMRRLEVKKLPVDLDYAEIRGLRLEAQEKLNRVRPLNVGQASRISGVSPADISVLLVYLAQKGKRGNGE